MSNPEHLAILEQGVEEWNKWRQAHRDVEPDLSGAEVQGIIFGDNDIGSVEGLDDVLHKGSSITGVD